MPPIALVFESELGATPERVWTWITSVEGIAAELAPIMRMTVPAGIRGIGDVPIAEGHRLFRSWILLFGVLPIDRSDLTLLELSQGQGFVEQSPMSSMRLWRHERRISVRGGTTILTDRLAFEPRFAPRAVGWFIRKVFEHRHRVLRKRLG